MSYNSIVYNVMIASPGDVESERSIIREIIYEWNAVHSERRNIVLLPVGWETHSSPEMGSSPQEIINNQILYKCDLLVGVFWTRIGTATDKYISGSVEEIEKIIESGKPTMLYFSCQPVLLKSVDILQYNKLTEFKESCQSRGLYEEYQSLSDFREKLYRHLQIKINGHPLFQESFPDSGEKKIEEPKTIISNLTNEAKMLLKQASIDSRGMIRYHTWGDTKAIEINERHTIIKNDRRVEALWEAAIEELVSQNLMIPQGNKGEIFQISNLGYKIADMIEI